MISTITPTHYALDDQLTWTENELSFIENHPIIRLGVDPQFVPFEFIDRNGEYQGVTADYLSFISEKTGLEFEVRKDLSWPEAYDLALEREVDVLPAVGITSDREAHFLFSKSYYYFKRVITTRDSDVHISSMEDLEGLAVAVQRNSSHHSYLLSYRNINLSLYDSVEAALIAVATGEEKAFIGNFATTNYLIRSTGLSNLRFVAFEAEQKNALHLAVRKDWPELVSIFNKALHTMTEKEKNDIHQKWVDLEADWDYGPLVHIAIIIVSLFAVMLIVSLFWIARLRKEINRREKVQLLLEDARRTSEQMNEKLQVVNGELEKLTMMDGLTGIYNRRYFDSFLQKLWGINKTNRFPIALIMLDIDNFKVFNDTFGHLAGDQCLKNVASLINSSIDRQGDFVARYGGEEFAIILSNTTEDEAVELAEKIRLKVKNAIIYSADSPITISLGVAILSMNTNMEPNDLINLADRALYEAKRRGRNRVVKASTLTDNE